MNRSWYIKNGKQDSPDTIHQILAFGALPEIKSLKNTVGQKTLTELFLRFPKKIYTPQALHFIKNFILHISSHIDEKKYLKFTPRYTR